jgi:hypothetical protein
MKNRRKCSENSLIFVAGILVGVVIVNLNWQFTTAQLVLAGVSGLVFYITQRVLVVSSEQVSLNQ